MARIVLTADRAVFTDFRGVDALGFGLCVPCRLVPRLVEYCLIAPHIASHSDGRAAAAPYALAKVEASLLAAGFSRDEVVIAPPERLGDVIDRDTDVVGVHALDPQGLAPVSWTLRALFGGGDPCTKVEFESLMRVLARLKERYGFSVVVGGPGAWQLRDHVARGTWIGRCIDVLYEGEAEVTFPRLVRELVSGREVPRHVVGEPAPLDAIPPTTTPSRNGIIQVTRGCPRRCRFCSPTTVLFRSMPIDIIVREVEVTLASGIRHVAMATEDILLYGARGVKVNEGAVKRLYAAVLAVCRRHGVDRAGFSHVTPSSALQAPALVRWISEENLVDHDHPMFPQVGLESGSPRIVRLYFRGKPLPWGPEEWPRIVLDATRLFNENHWYLCYTYIVGYPEAVPEDYVKTTELIDRLAEEGFMGWTFPLLLIPIGGTMVENEARLISSLSELPREAVDCMVRGWEVSVRFSRRIYPKLLGRLKRGFTGRVLVRLTGLAVDAMERWVRMMKADPEEAIREFSTISIRGLGQLTTALLKTTLPRTLGGPVAKPPGRRRRVSCRETIRA